MASSRDWTPKLSIGRNSSQQTASGAPAPLQIAAPAADIERASSNAAASTSQLAAPIVRTSISRRQRQRITPLSTQAAQPQLVFELGKVPSGLRVSQPRTALAAFATVELLQRSAPLRTVSFHLSRPVEQLGRALSAQVSQTPVAVRRFVAGAIAGAMAKTATAPLEKLRMELMTNGQSQPLDIIRRTWMEGGLGAFFGGNAADVLRVMPSKAIELAAFDAFKRVLAPSAEQRPGPLFTMLAGALAGLTATTACFPLETVRTRMAVAPRGTYSGIVDCFQKSIAERGIGTLYRGVPASMIGAVPYSALRFAAYDGMKVLYRRRHGEELPPHVLVAAGALAGVAASTATFPLEVIRRRLMAGATYSSVPMAIRTIAAEEGWKALYRGLGVSCLKQAPQTGITLWAYDYAKTLMNVSSSSVVA